MDGLLIINKRKNMTSRDVVNIVEKKLNTKKVGHTGTLDPLATGVLVIAINKALKLVDDITSLNKEYIERHNELWDRMREKYQFVNKELEFDEAVYLNGVFDKYYVKTEEYS